MKSQTENQRLIKKMLKRYSNVSKTLQYEMVADNLGISPRLARYIESDPNRNVPKPVEKLLRILA